MDFHTHFHFHMFNIIALGKYEDKEKCESVRIKYFLMRTVAFGIMMRVV